MKNIIIQTAILIIIFVIFYPSIKFVLERNDKLCKSRFGYEYVYKPTISSGYCLDIDKGVRKYLD